MFDINMYDLSDLPNKVIGEPDWCLMTQKIINSLTIIILSILFPLARWATIEMPTNRQSSFSTATGDWANAKRTLWYRVDSHVHRQPNEDW